MVEQRTPTPAEIVAKISAQENSPAWSDQAKLMDEALDIWNLNEYLTDMGQAALLNLEKYTSNDPRTFADMVVAMLSQAVLRLEVPVTDQPREERDADSMKERFAQGCLRAGDERLANLLLPTLQDATAWQSAMRGGIVCAWLLAKDEDEQTYVHIMPFDRRYSYWGMGRRGLAWACHKLWKLPGEIEADYGITLPDKEKDLKDGMEVFDWYDTKNNMVCTAQTELKEATPHGSPRVPVTITFVGQALPLSTPGSSRQVTMRGQDIYHSLRDVYKLQNFLRSAHAVRTRWEINPNFLWPSKTGDRPPPRENIMVGTGKAIPVVVGEHPEPLKLPEVSKEALTLEGTVSMDKQKGSFSDVVTGMAPYPMSGVAIDRYRQPVQMVIAPCQKAMEITYKQGLQLLCDQYASRAFEPMEVSGRDRQRRYFKLEITPEIVAQGGEIEVEMRPNLPEDEPSRWATYASARQPDANGIPGISQRTGLEKIIGLSDVELEMSAIMTEVSQRLSPWALADEMIQAAERQGDATKAKIWLAEAMIAMQKKGMEMAQMGLEMPGGGNGNGRGLVDRMGRPLGQTQPINKGFPSTVLHGAQVGNPPRYNPAQGPQVPPGTPRPGDLTEEQKMMLRSQGYPLG